MIWYGDMTNTMLVQLLFLKLKKKHILFRHLGPEAFLFIKAKSTTHFREWKALYCMSSSKPALSAVLPDSLLSHLCLLPESVFICGVADSAAAAGGHPGSGWRRARLRGAESRGWPRPGFSGLGRTGGESQASGRRGRPAGGNPEHAEHQEPEERAAGPHYGGPEQDLLRLLWRQTGPDRNLQWTGLQHQPRYHNTLLPQ